MKLDPEKLVLIIKERKGVILDADFIYVDHESSHNRFLAAHEVCTERWGKRGNMVHYRCFPIKIDPDDLHTCEEPWAWCYRRKE